MNHQWTQVEPLNGFPLYRCRRCGTFVEVCSDGRSEAELLATVGECPGEVRPRLPAARPPRGTETAGASPEKMPSLVRQAWDLTRSLADFVADGLKTVSEEQYRQRLKICDACPHRRGNRCTRCGCYLALKARGRAFRCPADRWPAVEAAGVP